MALWRFINFVLYRNFVLQTEQTNGRLFIHLSLRWSLRLLQPKHGLIWSSTRKPVA